MQDIHKEIKPRVRDAVENMDEIMQWVMDNGLQAEVPSALWWLDTDIKRMKELIERYD